MAVPTAFQPLMRAGGGFLEFILGFAGGVLLYGWFFYMFFGYAVDKAKIFDKRDRPITGAGGKVVASKDERMGNVIGIIVAILVARTLPLNQLVGNFWVALVLALFAGFFTYRFVLAWRTP
ncbi:hypothetical protein HY489_03285 [Candidatus Woesearchaeota archaeon]|nr:hypothetical protein [Candidatus Woesearchaeota archaeon]